MIKLSDNIKLLPYIDSYLIQKNHNIKIDSLFIKTYDLIIEILNYKNIEEIEKIIDFNELIKNLKNKKNYNDIYELFLDYKNINKDNIQEINNKKLKKNKKDILEINKDIQEINKDNQKINQEINNNKLKKNKKYIQEINKDIQEIQEINKDNIWEINKDNQEINKDNIWEINKDNQEINKKLKYKKKKISATLKRLVWNKWIGEEIGKFKCLCCNISDITAFSFNCGHIIAESKGGDTILSNLKPICQNCNSSMGCMNMDDFMKSFK
jgi:hypothetical protein